MFLGVLSNAGSAILGRNINRDGKLSVVTVISMGTGSLLLMAAGIISEPFPAISATNFLYIAWLAIINTALAFTLWNKSLRILTAVESSIINGTMLIQIALLSYIFLDETISFREICGMIIAGQVCFLQI